MLKELLDGLQRVNRVFLIPCNSTQGTDCTTELLLATNENSETRDTKSECSNGWTCCSLWQSRKRVSF